MKKIVVFGICLLLFSCQKKKVLLPQIPETIVSEIRDHSPIYMFFEVKGKDTLVDVNRKNSISSTNWLFTIDKRLPLKLIIPEIQKLQAKKESSTHKSETAENYFTYMDSEKKALAFAPFTNMVYKLEKPKNGINVFFSKNKILVDEIKVKRDSLKIYLNKLPEKPYHNLNFCFDKNDSYENYLKNIIFIRSLEVELIKQEEYIF